MKCNRKICNHKNAYDRNTPPESDRDKLTRKRMEYLHVSVIKLSWFLGYLNCTRNVLMPFKQFSNHLLNRESYNKWMPSDRCKNIQKNLLIYNGYCVLIENTQDNRMEKIYLYTMHKYTMLYVIKERAIRYSNENRK